MRIEIKTTPITVDVPQSLSIVSSSRLRILAARTILSVTSDYLFAGVSTTQGEGHRDAVVFRGGSEFNALTFFIDGILMRDDVRIDRPLYNLEQVEVAGRGPNALLLGLMTVALVAF